MRDDGNVAHRNAILPRNESYKGVEVFHQITEILGIASFTGRTSVAAGVPCKHRKLTEVQRVY